MLKDNINFFLFEALSCFHYSLFRYYFGGGKAAAKIITKRAQTNRSIRAKNIPSLQ